VKGATNAEGSSEQTVRETAGSGKRRLTGADHNLPLLLDQCYKVHKQICPSLEQRDQQPLKLFSNEPLTTSSFSNQKYKRL